MNKEVTTPRRERLLNSLAENESVIVFAALEGKLKKFKQDNNFLYLTGIATPGAIYIAIKRGSAGMEYLFIQRGIPEREVWEGKMMTKEEAREISGIANVLYLDEFNSNLAMFAPMMSTLYANLGEQHLDRPLSYQMHSLLPLTQRFPQIKLRDLSAVITPLRKVKDAWEVEQMQKAIDVTGQGIRDVWDNSYIGMNEFEIEAMIFYRIQRSGLTDWGFSPIIAAGINAATLHYGKNECEILDGDLVLLDVGAEHLNYSADITRCFPINGKFSPRQADVYNSVLSVNKAIIEMIRPGVKLSFLQQRSRELLAEEMIKLGLIKHPGEVVKYYMHGIGHFLGMDTHDVGGREATLEVGNIITVEPGIYIPEENLGVRIEDDILVTESGYQNLSIAIPKEIEQIEAILRERK